MAKHPAPAPRTVPKKPVKVCAGGHRQGVKWKKSDPCWQCDAEARAALQNDPVRIRAEREAETAKVGPIPDVMVIRCHDGPNQVFTVPKHLRRRGARRGAR